MKFRARKKRSNDRPSVPADDVAWIAEHRLPFHDHAVGYLVPVVFERYARVFHPAWAPSADNHIPVRWDAVALWSGRTMHALAQWESLSRPVAGTTPDAPFVAPDTDGLPPQQLGALCELLATYTGTPEDCFIGVWEGYAGPVEAWTGPDLLRLEQREYLVRRGPLSLAMEVSWMSFPYRRMVEPPNLVWPADRVWFVASDPDLDSTYLGGPAALIDALIAQRALEAWPVSPTDHITIDSDEVNA